MENEIQFSEHYLNSEHSWNVATRSNRWAFNSILLGLRLRNSVVECGVRFGMCVQRWTHSLGGRILHGWHRGYRCDALALSTWIQFVPGGFEAFRCDVWSKVQRHKKAPRRELCTHTHGPACNIRGSTRSPAMAEGGIYIFVILSKLYIICYIGYFI